MVFPTYTVNSIVVGVQDGNDLILSGAAGNITSDPVVYQAVSIGADPTLGLSNDGLFQVRS